MKIYPSLISSPLLSLGKTIIELNELCDGYHIDIMDDHFVPNLTWGSDFCNSIKKITKLPLHLHLMVDDPCRWLDRLALTEGDTFIFHLESFSIEDRGQGVDEIIVRIREKKWRVGIALSPDTSLEQVLPLLSRIDELLIMSVYPGFSGQKFLSEQLEKAKTAFGVRASHGYTYEIAMDGGISLETIGAASRAGIDAVAAASAIFFSHNSYKETLALLYSQAQAHQI